MKKFYQTEWFGIKFSTFASLDKYHIANEAFYDKFYDQFYHKFSSFTDLPIAWKIEKRTIANFIANISREEDKIISIGCGNGFIETCLADLNRQVIAVEPSLKASLFLQSDGRIKMYHGYFPDCMNASNESNFDLGIMCAIDYAFVDSELLLLLQHMRKYPITELLLVSVSIYEDTVLDRTKDIIKYLIGLLGTNKYKIKGQLWGYMRTPKELCDIVNKAGYHVIRTGYINPHTFWIKGSSK